MPHREEEQRPCSEGIVSILAAASWAVRLGRRRPKGDTPPRPPIYNDFGPFYDGDYADALKGFRGRSAAASIKTAQSRWIDSICYETMCGECYFQMGRLRRGPAALHQRPATVPAISRLDDQGAVSARRSAPAGRRREKGRPLGRRAAGNPSWASIPPTMMILQGQIDISRRGPAGRHRARRRTCFPSRRRRSSAARRLAMRRRATLLGRLPSTIP